MSMLSYAELPKGVTNPYCELEYDDLADLDAVLDTKDNLKRMRERLRELVSGLNTYK